MAAVTHRKWWWGNTAECARATVYIKGVADAESFMAWAGRGGSVDAVRVTLNYNLRYARGNRAARGDYSEERLKQCEETMQDYEQRASLMTPVFACFGATFNTLERLDVVVFAPNFGYLNETAWLEAITSLRVLTIEAGHMQLEYVTRVTRVTYVTYVTRVGRGTGVVSDLCRVCRLCRRCLDRLTNLEQLTLGGRADHKELASLEVEHDDRGNGSLGSSAGWREDGTDVTRWIGTYSLTLPPSLRSLTLRHMCVTKPAAFAELREFYRHWFLRSLHGLHDSSASRTGRSNTCKQRVFHLQLHPLHLHLHLHLQSAPWSIWTRLSFRGIGGALWLHGVKTSSSWPRHTKACTSRVWFWRTQVLCPRTPSRCAPWKSPDPIGMTYGTRTWTPSGC